MALCLGTLVPRGEKMRLRTPLYPSITMANYSYIVHSVDTMAGTAVTTVKVDNQPCVVVALQCSICMSLS